MTKPTKSNLTPDSGSSSGGVEPDDIGTSGSSPNSDSSSSLEGFISWHNVKGHAPAESANTEPGTVPNNPPENEIVAGGGLCAPSCSRLGGILMMLSGNPPKYYPRVISHLCSGSFDDYKRVVPSNEVGETVFLNGRSIEGRVHDEQNVIFFNSSEPNAMV